MNTYALNINAGKPCMVKTWHNCSRRRQCTILKCHTLETSNKACFDPTSRARWMLKEAYKQYLYFN